MLKTHKKQEISLYIHFSKNITVKLICEIEGGGVMALAVKYSYMNFAIDWRCSKMIHNGILMSCQI